MTFASIYPLYLANLDKLAEEIAKGKKIEERILTLTDFQPVLNETNPELAYLIAEFQQRDVISLFNQIFPSIVYLQSETNHYNHGKQKVVVSQTTKRVNQHIKSTV